MKSYRKELWFKTRQRRELINITPQVQECLALYRLRPPLPASGRREPPAYSL
jgi:thiamine phosphate synthase YjbQ (UPF0047 family)